jgi:cysteine desulfurase
MLCVGFGAAARLADERRTCDHQHVEQLWNAAIDALGPNWVINGSTEQRYHGNLNIRREGLDGARLISDLRDVAFSLGSACASGYGRPSHVLRALGLDDRATRSSIRLGFGRYTTQEEITDACRRIAEHAAAQEKLVA